MRGNSENNKTMRWFLLVLFTLGAKCAEDTVNFDEVKTLKKNSTVLFVDVRNSTEILQTGLIPGSVNIPLSHLEEELIYTPAEEFLGKYGKKKPKIHTPIIFTCQTGKRSRKAQQIAWKLGFKDVRTYPGSWNEWSERNHENSNKCINLLM